MLTLFVCFCCCERWRKWKESPHRMRPHQTLEMRGWRAVEVIRRVEVAPRRHRPLLLLLLLEVQKEAMVGLAAPRKGTSPVHDVLPVPSRITKVNGTTVTQLVLARPRPPLQARLQTVRLGNATLITFFSMPPHK